MWLWAPPFTMAVVHGKRNNALVLPHIYKHVKG